MQTEILMIGTELLLGQIVDTNAAFMGQALAEHGINLFQKTTVGDNRGRIMAALDAALTRSDVVLASGGLGPTEDDITRECIAELLDRPLEFREGLYRELCERFTRYRFHMTENNRKQATAPRGGRSIENPHGTAPGLIVEDERGTIICMPGVPRELKPMLTDQVIPYLRARYGLTGLLHSRVLKVCGMGESKVDAAIGDLIVAGQNPTLGLLAAPDAVRIRLTARAETVEAALALIAPIEAQVRARLPGLVMGVDDMTLEQAVDALLVERGWRLYVAETNTGGLIAQRLTAAGAASFTGALVAAGSPTAETLLDMAAGHVVDSCCCVLALAANAGEGATRIVFRTPEDTTTWQLGFADSSERSQVRAGIAALEGIRRRLTGVAGPA